MVEALDAKNVNLVLPYAPAEAEAELVAAYEQALAVRGKGAEAKALADRPSGPSRPVTSARSGGSLPAR